MKRGENLEIVGAIIAVLSFFGGLSTCADVPEEMSRDFMPGWPALYIAGMAVGYVLYLAGRHQRRLGDDE